MKGRGFFHCQGRRRLPQRAAEGRRRQRLRRQRGRRTRDGGRNRQRKGAAARAQRRQSMKAVTRPGWGQRAPADGHHPAQDAAGRSIENCRCVCHHATWPRPLPSSAAAFANLRDCRQEAVAGLQGNLPQASHPRRTSGLSAPSLTEAQGSADEQSAAAAPCSVKEQTGRQLFTTGLSKMHTAQWLAA